MRKPKTITPGKKDGRPETVIDWVEFDKLCAMQATLLEIAAWFNCSDQTIENKVKNKFGTTFLVYYQQKSKFGKISLRRWQMQAARKGSIPMLIFLGKQYLEQSDKIETIMPKPLIIENLDGTKTVCCREGQEKEALEESNENNS